MENEKYARIIEPMTAEELCAFKSRFQFTALRLARAVGYDGAHADRTVRRWESGGPIPGAVALLLRMLADELDDGDRPNNVIDQYVDRVWAGHSGAVGAE